MKKRPDIQEWILKAEQDYLTAETMARKKKTPVPDIVGFHSQQCKDPLLETLRFDLRLLNLFSVQFRYPGESCVLFSEIK